MVGGERVVTRLGNDASREEFGDSVVMVGFEQTGKPFFGWRFEFGATVNSAGVNPDESWVEGNGPSSCVQNEEALKKRRRECEHRFHSGRERRDSAIRGGHCHIHDIRSSSRVRWRWPHGSAGGREPRQLKGGWRR